MRSVNTLSATLFAGVLLAGCSTDGRRSSSNTGPDRTSLSTPSSNANLGNAANAAYATQSNSNAAAIENSFYTSAARGGLAEVEMGKLAQAKATNPEVKKFAQLMVTDHTKANDELKTLASAKNLTLPTEISSSQRSTIEELNGLSGAEFDRTYVNEMVEDHEADVQLFEDQAENGGDAEVKAFAAKTLPTLKKHLELIKDIQSRLQ